MQTAEMQKRTDDHRENLALLALLVRQASAIYNGIVGNGPPEGADLTDWLELVATVAKQQHEAVQRHQRDIERIMGWHDHYDEVVEALAMLAAANATALVAATGSSYCDTNRWELDRDDWWGALIALGWPIKSCASRLTEAYGEMENA